MGCGCSANTNGITLAPGSRPGVTTMNGATAAVMYVGEKVGSTSYFLASRRYVFGANPQHQVQIMQAEDWADLSTCCGKDFVEIPLGMYRAVPNLSALLVGVYLVAALTDDYKALLLGKGVKTIGQVLAVKVDALSGLLGTDGDGAVALQNEIRAAYGLPLLAALAPVAKKAKTPKADASPVETKVAAEQIGVGP